MKKLLPALLLSFSTVAAVGQTVYIPDPVFREFLTDTYPGCMSGDNLDTQCPEVMNETELMIMGAGNYPGLTDLTGIAAFENLEELNIMDQELTWLPELPSTLKTLICNDNSITSLPALPAVLESLHCPYNELSNLPELPSSLETLSCGENHLTVLPDLPIGLKHLDFSHNEISSLPSSLPPSLESFGCRQNLISELPNPLPTTLDFLDCTWNQIIELPALPATLTRLECSLNPLGELPSLPQGLTRLKCFGIGLNELSDFPPALYWIDVSNNHLTQLPEIPDGVGYLICSNNLISTIPELPAGLYELQCAHNQLNSLPDLPNSMIWLSCNNNNIAVIPPLPEFILDITIGYNNLNCLPIIPNSLWLDYDDIDGNNIQCLPNDPTGSMADYLDLPLCIANNIHDCHYLRQVTGTVYFDENDDCSQNTGEIDLSGRIVASSYGTVGISDSTGRYEVYVDTGVHTITQTPLNELWEITCPSIPITVSIDALGPDTLLGNDIPNSAVVDCPLLEVSLASPYQRPCFTTNFYHVSYCNNGTMTASDAYVDLEFPPEIIPISSTIPWQDMGGGLYRFDLGDVDIDECGTFSIGDSVSCDAVLGFTPCAKAEIYPSDPCFPPDPAWDGASIEVTAECVGNSSIEYTLTNVGMGNMAAPSNYRIVEWYYGSGTDVPFQLNAGESLVVTHPADGSTYFLMADQTPGHPGASHPQAWVEGCGPEPYDLSSITCFPMDDQDPHVDIECVTLSSSYDPNDKRVVPEGFGDERVVHPNDSLLEYTVRFQNTGTDTAFNIEIVDTLDISVLDPTTFRSGVSSHPYTVRMHGDGIITWRFENILLPDSFVNEPASNGLVKFKIKTRPGLPNGTVVNNSAAIYFDFNAAIITNTSFITIDDQAMLVSTNDPQQQLRMRAQPNPFNERTVVSWDGELTNGSIVLSDAVGREVFKRPIFSNTFNLNRENLDSGIYLLQLMNEGQTVGSMKLVVD